MDIMNEQQQLKPLTPGTLVPALNPIIVSDGAGLELVEKYFKRIAEQQKSPEFAADYESNIAPTFVDRKARLLALGDKNEQYIIDFLPFAGSSQALIAGQGFRKTSSWAKPIVKVLEPAFNSKAFLKVGQRLGFEYQVSEWNLGMRMWNIYSTDYAERLIWAGLHSLKDVNFFSLAGQAARYFGVIVDKTQQKLYDLESPLTDEQIAYSCLDLRLPIAIRAMQLPILRKDQLTRITQIENDAIGFFEDIHLEGWDTDTEKWETLAQEWLNKYRESIERLDTFLLPVVGPKFIDEANLEPVLDEWKTLTFESHEEKGLKQQIKETKDKAAKDALRAKMAEIAKARKEQAAAARLRYNAIRKSITASKKIVESCEGEAAINYGSNAQMLKALHKMKGFNAHNLPNTDDSALEKLSDKPVIAAFRDYRTYSKLLETYGPQWTREFTHSPSAEDGWVNPITKKVHSTINQLEAETGRTSSVKPNIQNLPHDERLRACFVADPPNEDIRISDCCESETHWVAEPHGHIVCDKCGQACGTHAEEYVIVTCDMSGAELRIIAEESGSKVWIDAFRNNWDVHSVGTELLYPEEWLAADQSGQTIIKDGKEIVLPPCAYFNKTFVASLGREEDHQKCKCPNHLELRDRNKATNFLLAYGGGPAALMDAINDGKSKEKRIDEDDASELMKKHERANPEVWEYLERSGKEAVKQRESRSKCGRRRRFAEPTWELARDKAKERMFDSLKKKGKLILADGTKLTLEDMNPEKWQINSAMKGMFSSMERRGKNHRIQSLNKTIAALAFGAGFDKDGKAYLWHHLPKYKAKSKNFVHDEGVFQCPKRFGEALLVVIQDCIKRAGAEFLEKVTAESEGRVAKHWKK